MRGSGAKTVFTCQSCGHQVSKWLGRCPQCGAWNSLAEEVVGPRPAGEALAPPRRSIPQPLANLICQPEIRQPSGITEFDRVLGGSLVAGSVVLLGGDPGIGKSTLILQVLDRLCRENLVGLYLSGEEGINNLGGPAGQQGLQVQGQGVDGEVPALKVRRQGGAAKFGQIQEVPARHHPGSALPLVQQDIGPSQGLGQIPGQVQGVAGDGQVQVGGAATPGQFPDGAPHEINLGLPGPGQVQEHPQGRRGGQGHRGLEDLLSATDEGFRDHKRLYLKTLSLKKII